MFAIWCSQLPTIGVFSHESRGSAFFERDAHLSSATAAPERSTCETIPSGHSWYSAFQESSAGGIPPATNTDQLA